jgi:hypothetical protein
MMNEVTCPICGADVLLNGDERSGDLTFCEYCDGELRLRREENRWEADAED